MDFSKVGVTRLNSRNFRSWSFKVKMVLMKEGLWNRIEPGTPPNPVTAAWTEGDAKAMATIVLLVEDNQHNLIMDKETAKTTWDALKAHHHKASLTGKVALLKEVCSTNYQEGENMEEFLYGMDDLFARLENSGEKLSAHMQVAMLLRSMPSAFDTLTTALESRTDKELTMDLVRSKLIDESEKLYGTDSFVGERALKAVGETRARGVECFFCGQKGHLQRQCQEYLEMKRQAQAEKRVLKVRENDEKSFTFMVRRNKSPLFARSWLLDSGATSHICSDVNFFVRLESVSHSNVVVADGTEKRAEGIGDCRIECLNSSGEVVELTLTNVLFVPSISGNMISISKLTAKGVCAKFGSAVCKLVFANQIIAIGDKKCDMYWLRTCPDRVAKVMVQPHEKNSWQDRDDQNAPEVLGENQRENLASGLEQKDGSQQAKAAAEHSETVQVYFGKPAAKMVASHGGAHFEEEHAQSGNNKECSSQLFGQDDDPQEPVPDSPAPGPRRSQNSTAGVPSADRDSAVEGEMQLTKAVPTKVLMDPGFQQQKEEMGKQLVSAKQNQCLVGALLYATVISRPETTLLGRRVQHLTKAGWKKAGDVNKPSTSASYLFKLGGDVIGWGHNKQTCVTQFSAEAEYTFVRYHQKLKWVRGPACFPTPAKEEKWTCVVLTENTRIANLLEAGMVRLEYIPSAEAGLLAKPLPVVELGLQKAIGID